jgi:hypothetical protein
MIILKESLKLERYLSSTKANFISPVAPIEVK